MHSSASSQQLLLELICTTRSLSPPLPVAPFSSKHVLPKSRNPGENFSRKRQCMSGQESSYSLHRQQLLLLLLPLSPSSPFGVSLDGGSCLPTASKWKAGRIWKYRNSCPTPTRCSLMASEQRSLKIHIYEEELQGSKELLIPLQG